MDDAQRPALSRRKQRLISMLVGLVSLGALIGAVVSFGAAFRNGGPAAARPSAAGSAAISQPQAEQLAVNYLQQYYPGAITKTDIQPTTLGQLVGLPPCSAPEFLFRAMFVTMRTDSYNPCDPQTELWVAQFQGQFDFGQGHTGDSAEVVLLANGEFYRAGGTVR